MEAAFWRAFLVTKIRFSRHGGSIRRMGAFLCPRFAGVVARLESPDDPEGSERKEVTGTTSSSKIDSPIVF